MDIVTSEGVTFQGLIQSQADELNIFNIGGITITINHVA
jgi:hypothetical protein